MIRTPQEIQETPFVITFAKCFGSETIRQAMVETGVIPSLVKIFAPNQFDEVTRMLALLKILILNCYLRIC
jgi:hypothetical protein